MSLKWGEERVKGFSDPVKKAEEINDWAWWTLFSVVVVMEVIVVLKLLQKI